MRRLLARYRVYVPCRPRCRPSEHFVLLSFFYTSPPLNLGYYLLLVFWKRSRDWFVRLVRGVGLREVCVLVLSFSSIHSPLFYIFHLDNLYFSCLRSRRLYTCNPESPSSLRSPRLRGLRHVPWRSLSAPLSFGVEVEEIRLGLEAAAERWKKWKATTSLGLMFSQSGIDRAFRR